MHSGRKAKESGLKSQRTRKSTVPVSQKAGKKSRENSKTGPVSLQDTRPVLRSNPSADCLPPLNDPEGLLRKSRIRNIGRDQVHAQDRPQSLTRDRLQRLTKSIEASVAKDYRAPDHSDPKPSNQEKSLPSEDIDSEQEFYCAWGYLPPLDEEAVSVINAIIANPEMAKGYERLSPSSKGFPQGLEYRNVCLTESSAPDLHAGHIQRLTPGKSKPETDAERELHDQLWTFDQAKCNKGSNEALFQRTLMMNLIARHSFIYEKDATDRLYLDFSVEEIWDCPPMPTRAYDKGKQFLTQPKPDLAVCFRRQALIPNHLWNTMPEATKRLACYEGTDEIPRTRIFHFFTIEAKKANIGADDTVGKRQSLNNASQALHNMFEFFKDAGRVHEENFFAKVRFFSVVASTEGLTIRIHRATREPRDGSDEGFIMPNNPNYPLRFEHQEFFNIQKRHNFDRGTVFKTFEKILIAYGANELGDMLSSAAKTIMEKLEENSDEMKSRENSDFYRYGQTKIPPNSRIPTPAKSQASTEANPSGDMLRRRTVTQMQPRALQPQGQLNERGKRYREESEDDDTSETRIRQRNRWPRPSRTASIQAPRSLRERVYGYFL